MSRCLTFLPGAVAAAFLGCHPLTNAADHTRLVCGDDVASGAAVVRVVAADGSALGVGAFEAVVVGSDSAATAPVSRKGCVVAQATDLAGVLVVRTTAGDAAAVLAMADAGSHDIDHPLPLDANPAQLVAEDVSPACGGAASVNHAVAFDLHAAKSPRLNYLRLGTQLDGPAGWHRATPLTPVGAAASQLALGDDVPEGAYRLTIELENAFDRAAGLPSRTSVCPLVVNRTVPVVSLQPPGVTASGLLLTSDAVAPDGTQLLAADPGMPLQFAVRDASTASLYFCLQAQVEGSGIKSCDGGFKPAGGALYAPDQGLWTLSYYALDAAGNRSATTTVPLVVVHRDKILRLRAVLGSIAAGVASNRVFEAYPSLFEALEIYEGLPLAMERRVVQDEMVAATLQLGPRLVERQRYDARGSPVAKVAYAPSGDGAAVLTQSGVLDLLATDGARQATLTGIDSFWFTQDGGRLVLRRQGLGAVSIYDRAGGAEVAVWPASDEAVVSADGAVIVGSVGGLAVVADAAVGKVLASQPLPDGTAPANGSPSVGIAVAADGAAVVFPTTKGLVAWRWRTNQTYGPLPLGSNSLGQACEVTALAVTSGGARVYFGTNDSSVPGGTIDVPAAAAVPCGLRRWSLATPAASDLLVYANPVWSAHAGPLVPAGLSPNDVTLIALSADGMRAFALSGSSNRLTAWSDASVSGVYKTIGVATDGGLALTVGGAGLVATASTSGEVRLFDQQTDFAAGQSDYVSSERLSHVDPAPLTLALPPRDMALLGGDLAGRARFWHFGATDFRSLPTSALKQDPHAVRLADGTLVSAYRASARTVSVLRDHVPDSLRLDHPDSVTGVVVAGDGTVVTATATTLRIWDVTGVPIFAAQVSGTNSLQIAGGVVVAASPSQIQAWRLTAGQLTLVGTLAVHAASLSLGPDGANLALVRQTAAGSRLDVYTAPALTPVALDQPYAVVNLGLPFQPFSPDGRQIVGADGANAVVYSSAGQVVAKVPLAAADAAGTGISMLAFAPDGAGLLAVPASPDRKDFVMLTRAGGVAARFTGYSGALTALLVLPDADLVLGEGAQDKVLRAWSGSGVARYQIGDADFPVSAFAVTARGDGYLTLASATWRLQAWPVRSVEAFARVACAALHDYLGSHDGDWAVAARALCAGPADD